MNIKEKQLSAGPEVDPRRQLGNPKTFSAARLEADLKACLPRLQATPQEMYPFKLATGSGVLWICPCDGAIRTRFDEVPKEEPVGASLNRDSGTWNFEGLDETARVARAIFFIGRIAL